MPSAQKESRRFLIPLVILAILAVAAHGFLTLSPGIAIALDVIVVLLFALSAYVVYFFRDPERVVPADERLIVSAADGLVVGVEEVEEPDFHLGPMLRISVFLSVFDVHVNRAPVAGVVKTTVYKAGEFLDVRHPECSTRNECRSWWLETAQGDVAVRQIAGADRAANRRLGRGGFGAGTGLSLRHDPLRLAHGSFPPGGLHAAGQGRRPCPRRGDAYRALA